MKCLIDTHGKNRGSFPEQDLTEEQFFEQFAALEDGLALLQIHMRGMSPKTPNSSAASQGTCGDQFALRPYHRDKTRDRCRHAYPATHRSAEGQSGVTRVRSPPTQ